MIVLRPSLTQGVPLRMDRFHLCFLDKVLQTTAFLWSVSKSCYEEAPIRKYCITLQIIAAPPKPTLLQFIVPFFFFFPFLTQVSDLNRSSYTIFLLRRNRLKKGYQREQFWKQLSTELDKCSKRFMSMYGKNHYNIVISLQLIKINGKKSFLVLFMVSDLTTQSTGSEHSVSTTISKQSSERIAQTSGELFSIA